MKNTILALLLTLSTISFSQEEKIDYSLCRAGEKILGVWVYIRTSPIQEYVHVGEMKVRFAFDKSFFHKTVEKARKDHPNLNGIIFRGNGLAELIRFPEIGQTLAGVQIGEYIIVPNKRTPHYGEIVAVDHRKERVTYKYIDEYGESKHETCKPKYVKPIPESTYQKEIGKQLVEIRQHQFIPNETVSWSSGNDAYFGKIASINNKTHKATINYSDDYGDNKTKSVDFLKVNKLDPAKYKLLLAKHLDVVNLHKFKIGEEVHWTQNIFGKRTTYNCKVVGLDDKANKASIEYINEKNETKVSKVDYLKISKTAE